MEYTIKGTLKGSCCIEDEVEYLDARDLCEYEDDITEKLSEEEDLDLAEYIWDKELIKGIVTSIKIGVRIIDKALFSITKVIATRELTEEEKQYLLEYITGQFSDGWGEGFEQHSITEGTTTLTYEEELDEETGEWIEGEDYEANVYTYVNFYQSDNFELDFI